MREEFSTNHTFAVCAYKESPYLENCIKSLVNQSINTNILIATSTPCEHIRSIAVKYDIPLYIRDGKSDIKDDWNFAYNQAKTDWVTIAHQDDQYHLDYVKFFLKTISKYKNPIVFLTDYIPIKNNRIGTRDINSKIRKLLRKPLKNRIFAKSKFWKKKILAFGNCICCPTVTYNKAILGDSYFTSELKFNIDWDTFLKIANEDGSMAYVERPLTFYRVHDGATSKEFIENHLREKDDRAMFEKFWPKWMVNIIMLFYKRAYDTYKTYS